MNYTTLKKIKAHRPCQYGWEKLLASLNKTKADDEPVSLLHILNSNGFDDALWALRASDASDKDMRLYAVWCARQVQHLMEDPRSLQAIDVAERYANGEATAEELSAAYAAADAAADAAAAEAAAAEAAAAEAAAAEAAAAAAAAAASEAAAPAPTAAEAAAEGADAAAYAAYAAAYAAKKNRFIEVFCGGEK